MILQKCSKCKTKQQETGSSFHKRTKDILNPIPFLCNDCLRVERAINPTTKQKKTQEVCQFKREMGEIVKSFQAKVLSWYNIEKKIKTLCTRHGRARAPLSIYERKQIRLFYRNRPKGYHVDHVIPINRGGKHHLANLRYIPAIENIKKRDRILVDVIKKHLGLEEITEKYLVKMMYMNRKEAKNLVKRCETYTNNYAT